MDKYYYIKLLCSKAVSQPIFERLDKGVIIEKNYDDFKALYNFKENRIEIYDYEFIDWFDVGLYGVVWSFNKKDLEF